MDTIRQQLSISGKRVILVGAILKGYEKDSDNLTELTSLSETAGAVIVDRFQQKISLVNPATYIGRGKAEMLADRVELFEADMVIFDNDLSPGQIRALEAMLDTQVVDRSELILDIFANGARTKQAKLQIELAQLEYTYPRLTRMWSHLDTVTAGAASGGVGTRGTGEKQLEIDRRLVNKRITDLKRELAIIEKRRNREIDARENTFKICLVGYTNAGKSTVMNAVTEAGVLAENKLFATLDTRTKRWQLESGAQALLSDTVGFVRKLPHQLVESFKATLAEAVNADLLLHVVDASNERVFEQIESVNNVLEEIGCKDKDMLILLNKCDAIKNIVDLETLQTLYPTSITISAKANLNLDKVASDIAEKINGAQKTIRIVCEIANGKLQSYLRKHAEITDESYEENTVKIEARIGSNRIGLLKTLNPTKLEIS
ncbi:MAG: GTPase HflX [Sedimentisphaeraceae bacterium JB056]